MSLNVKILSQSPVQKNKISVFVEPLRCKIDKSRQISHICKSFIFHVNMADPFSWYHLFNYLLVLQRVFPMILWVEISLYNLIICKFLNSNRIKWINLLVWDLKWSQNIFTLTCVKELNLIAVIQSFSLW